MAGNNGFLGPERMWIFLAVAIALTACWKLLAPPPSTDSETMAFLNVLEDGQGRVEKLSRADCLRQDERLWVVLEDGVECISYVTSGLGARGEPVLVFLNGDVPVEDMVKEAPAAARTDQLERAGLLSKRLQLPVVIIGRPGLMGSTGFHLAGGRRDEALVIDATMTALKEKLGHGKLALAGQSGGARLIAQLMVLAHHDILCAAMGSGAYGVPGLIGGGVANTNVYGDPGRRYLVPLREIARVPAAPSRRSFVIGDTEDRRAQFSEQRAWADALSAAGHHAVLIEAHARDEEHHGTSLQALQAAGMCAKGATDSEITAAVKGL